MKRLTALLGAGALLVTLIGLGAPVAQAKCGDSPKPKVDWSKCDKERLNLREQDLSGAVFLRTDLSASDLMEANLSGATLKKANLARARLKAANLQGADLSQAQGDRTNFQEAILKGADLTKSELPRANLTEANLINANLSKSELGRAKMNEAKLDGAKIQYAYLARAVLHDASLKGTDFTGSYLFLMQIQGVDLSQAIGWRSPAGTRTPSCRTACNGPRPGPVATAIEPGAAKPKGLNGCHRDSPLGPRGIAK
jgi:uncharacterized protein YjbI with pentapeptide repeats